MTNWNSGLKKMHELAQLRAELNQLREEYNIVVMNGGNVENANTVLAGMDLQAQGLESQIADVRRWLSDNGVWHI